LKKNKGQNNVLNLLKYREGQKGGAGYIHQGVASIKFGKEPYKTAQLNEGIDKVSTFQS
jgi:hypothetical protein